MRSLVIKCTAGAQEPERASQAFTVATTAVASGAEVTLWLTGDATWFAVPGHAEAFELALSGSLAQARDLVVESGTLIICTQCAARRDISEKDLVPGARIAGAAAFTEMILGEGVQALVY